MEELYNKFQELKNDLERWDWILKNQDKGITVWLDNDDTYAQFNDDEEAEYLMQFNEYIGWADGIFVLMDVVGIKAESV